MPTIGSSDKGFYDNISHTLEDQPMADQVDFGEYNPELESYGESISLQDKLRACGIDIKLPDNQDDCVSNVHRRETSSPTLFRQS